MRHHGAVEPYAQELVDAAEAALPAWVVRCVTERITAWSGAAPPDVVARAEEAGLRARHEVGGALRTLLAADIDDQRGTPLSLLREAVRFPTAVLEEAGVPPVERDDFAERAFPGDPYDLSPASFADVAPALAGPGLAWGAGKALAHRRRHQPGGGPA